MTEYRLAPAKINLALHVTGRHADGYHLLESLVVFTRFGDRLAVRPAQADTFGGRRLRTRHPRRRRNEVLRARNLLRQAAGTATRPVAIRLEKNLPASSGVGGGSSDAAATLRALCRLWSIDPREETARGVAAALGADVPMCLSALPLVARGIGHDIVPLADFPRPIVLVNPGVSVSTPSVFSRLASQGEPAAAAAAPLCRRRRRRPLAGDDPQRPRGAGAGAGTRNRHGTRRAYPRRRTVCAHVGLRRDLLVPGAAGATEAAERIRREHAGWFVEATHTMASGEFEDEQD